MGVFDCICTESGLVIDGDQRLIVICEVAPERWVPIAPPIKGQYNSYGTMEIPDKLDAIAKAAVAIGRLLDYRDKRITPAKVTLKEMLDEIRGDGSGATLGGKAVSFALVDENIYSAIVKTVDQDAATTWRRFAQLGLGIRDLPLPNRGGRRGKPAPVGAVTKRLCEAILANPSDAAARQVYLDHLLESDDPRGKLLAMLPVIGKTKVGDLVALALPNTPIAGDLKLPAMKPALVDFVRFLTWGTTFTAACGEGQFTGYTTEYGPAKPYCVRARKKYEGMPALIAAVVANETVWKQRQAEDEDEDDDDDDDDDE